MTANVFAELLKQQWTISEIRPAYPDETINGPVLIDLRRRTRKQGWFAMTDALICWAIVGLPSDYLQARDELINTIRQWLLEQCALTARLHFVTDNLTEDDGLVISNAFRNKARVVVSCLPL